MEYDSQEEEMVMAGGGGGSYDTDSPANPTQVKRPSPVYDPLAMMVVVRNTGQGGYGECLKNHATRINGYALDSCLEFMAAGPEGTIDALKCAACDCHRKDAPFPTGNPYHHHHHCHHPPPPPHYAAFYRAAAPTGHLHVARPNPGATLALPAGGRAQFTREVEYHEEVVSDRSGGGGGGEGEGGGGEGSNSKPKRFRTKFSHEQKGKMLEFAERSDWRIQKHDENAVQEFCNEIGVNRHVLMVWMHNNKHTLGKKPYKN